MSPDLELIYVGDVMCSWCWGFAPVLERLERDFDVPLTLVNGGLRPGDAAEVLDGPMKAMIGGHWDHVEAASGQPFDRAVFDREGWVYDTELPAIAVVTMRGVEERETLRWFTRLQRAFYAEAVDVTDPAAYPDLLDGFDVDHVRFLELLRSDEMKHLAWRDFARARSMGISGFPTLVLRERAEHYIVTRGFAPGDALVSALAQWMVDRYGVETAGAVCSVDGVC